MSDWIDSKTFEPIPDDLKKSWRWNVEFDAKCPHVPSHLVGTCPADPGEDE
jgi:hypothetical protein